MSEASRLESCEKNIVALTRCLGKVAERLKEIAEDASSQEDFSQDLSNSLARVELEIDELKGRLSDQSQPSAAGAPSEAE